MSPPGSPTKGHKALIANSPAGDAGGKGFMRSLSRLERFKLAEGKMIQVIDSTGVLVIDFPLALFTAASTKPALVCDEKIMLTADLNTEQAKRLLSSMLQVAKASYVGDLPHIENTRTDLLFHSAAEALGMDSFTQRIFDLYFKRVNRRIPCVPNIEAIASIRTPSADKIFKQMAYHIGVTYYNDKITNRAAFEQYLTTNDRLRAAVEEVVDRKKIAAQRLVQHEQQNYAFLERERARQEKAEREKVAQAAVRAQMAAEKVKYQEREEKEMEVRKTMLEKKRAGEKLNGEEARAHEKLFGKAVAQ